MVTSHFEKWSEIVLSHLLACTDAKEVFVMVITVITDIESVIPILWHNVQITTVKSNLFKSLSRKHVIKQSVSHPCDPIRPLFRIFDIVHIIECIRKNWLNQQDAQYSFIFRSFEDVINSNLPASVSRAFLKILGINTDLNILPP
ncbi:hypothetical protein LOD99_15122 [Oopsacas minuta]|uniref:Uncharacterized protein n=1 Tax=Oopsacas minuta TaxID=111878 RepID=A0AAV7KC99_9METZ|nr:hypothetical protein LOD99_15122 [Oopsacas minuta]